MVRIRIETKHRKQITKEKKETHTHTQLTYYVYFVEILTMYPSANRKRQEKNSFAFTELYFLL